MIFAFDPSFRQKVVRVLLEHYLEGRIFEMTTEHGEFYINELELDFAERREDKL